VRRRDFIKSAAGAITIWPLPLRAQNPDRQRRIGVLLPIGKDDPDYQPWVAAFRQALQELGWVDSRNVEIEIRWATTNPAEIRRQAAELVALTPDVILATGTGTVGPLTQVTRTVPIVFPIIADPVAGGFVDSLARPGGNATGVNFLGAELGAKRLDLMLELVPAAKRVSVLIDRSGTASETFSSGAQSAAQAKGLQIDLLNADTGDEIDAAFAQVASDRPDFLMVGGGGLFFNRRIQLVQLAAHHRIPAMYSEVEFSRLGGLMSYGTSTKDAYHQVGVYTGRILRGAKPADLPVVQSTKIELLINAHTARMQGLTVPATLLATADEVIE
jgi:putative tryptophan/tyrosine transport system substrate-binding protein